LKQEKKAERYVPFVACWQQMLLR